MKYQVEISDNDVCIIDSYKAFKEEFDEILNEIQAEYPDNAVLMNRTRFSLKMEWAVHNFCYDINFMQKYTKDVDLDYPQPWYMTCAYCICGLFAWLCIA